MVRWSLSDILSDLVEPCQAPQCSFSKHRDSSTHDGPRCASCRPLLSISSHHPTRSGESRTNGTYVLAIHIPGWWVWDPHGGLRVGVRAIVVSYHANFRRHVKILAFGRTSGGRRRRRRHLGVEDPMVPRERCPLQSQLNMIGIMMEAKWKL
jgi:hypothetical protein